MSETTASVGAARPLGNRELFRDGGQRLPVLAMDLDAAQVSITEFHVSEAVAAEAPSQRVLRILSKIGLPRN